MYRHTSQGLRRGLIFQANNDIQTCSRKLQLLKIKTYRTEIVSLQ